jgi:hypothetical protein
MADLILHINGSPEHTQVFVGNVKVPQVQRVSVTPDGIQVWFPPPSLHLDKKAQIERGMALVNKIPGVEICHLATGDERRLGKPIPQARKKSKTKSTPAPASV